ncbi:MAG: SDR family NAD(P)-dependent oxidoreductase [Armatimonadota bacterium]|jgi:3-oxoacyl-[acyl-carrier protein] reductase
METVDLCGKWALVTGASRGVGRQISLGLARAGCNVVLHSRVLESTATLAAELAELGVKTFQVAAELSDAAQLTTMLETLTQSGPDIDILYNNAAIMTPYRQDWLNIPDEDYQRSFQVNVIALSRICHAFIPGMKARKWGRIVNVTSGIQDQPELIAYSISKGAVDKFTTDTSGHLAEHGVLMNTLDPGWLRTDLGGPNAPGDVTSVLPGALIPVLTETTHGQLFRAQDYANAQE